MKPYVTFWFNDYRDWMIPHGETIELESTYLMLRYRAFTLEEWGDAYTCQSEYNHGNRDEAIKMLTELYGFQEFVYTPHCFSLCVVHHCSIEYPKLMEIDGVITVKTRDSYPEVSIEQTSHLVYCFPSEDNLETMISPLRLTSRHKASEWCKRNGFETTIKATRLKGGFIANGNFKDLRTVIQENQIHWIE